MSEPAPIEPHFAPATASARQQSAAPWRSPAIEALALLSLASAVFFFHLGSYGLWEPDEARYAEIAREMLASRNFIVPHLNYVAYVEKPPLLYWLGAMWMALLGVNEFAARLTPALAALAGVSMTWFFVRRTMGRGRALLAGAILTTSTLYAVMAQVLTTDMLLAAAVTVALFALYLHWSEGGRWCWLGYAAIAMGLLAKGPVAAAIPILTLAIFLWWQGDLRGAIGRFHALAGGAMVMLIAAPWFITIAIREPGFVDFYFIGEHLRRFFEPSYSHGEPFYYYLPVLAAGMMPWTLMTPFIAWRSRARTPAGRFCIVAAAVVIVMFSAASAKLIPYILPAAAPIAVLLADGICSRAFPAGVYAGAEPAGVRIRFAAVGVILSVLGAAMLAVAMTAPLFSSPYVVAARPALYALGLIGVAGGALVAEIFRHWRLEAGLAAMVLVTAIALGAGSYVRLEAEPLRSYAALARAVQARAPDATLICYPRYVQGLPFYTRRRVILVGAPTELAFGQTHAADGSRYFFRSEDDVLRLWNMPGPVVLVIDERELNKLRDRLGGFTVIGSEWRKRAILKASEPRYAS
ncbi:MAG TPA: glycosyltransferase family 39 protein [Candidatus Binataceae bacterium]|nr:glycosyltransferase family 39 protein [Candidatus Binataceae bacterium]